MAAARCCAFGSVSYLAADQIRTAGALRPREAVLSGSADHGWWDAAVPLGGFIARHGADHAWISPTTYSG